MIITDKFVMVNFPKTGSSFVRMVLKQIHEKYNRLPNRIWRKLHLANKTLIELMLPKIDEKNSYGIKDQHGTYRQILEEHKQKTVVSIIRNPFDRYVSTYLYRWWEKYPPVDLEQMKRNFPNFPNLSFREYYEIIQLFGRENRLNGISPKIELGLHTIQFIQFYFKEPEEVLSIIDNDYIKQKMYLTDMAEIIFLHQENLNEELYEFLLGVGYPKKDISFIKEHKKVNVTARESNEMEFNNFYTKELVEDILEKDRLLFELFPEYLGGA